MNCRNRWQRAGRALAIFGLLGLGCAGCHLLPVGRVNPALDPRSLGRRERATSAEAMEMQGPTEAAGREPRRSGTAVSTPAGTTTALSVPLPELPLQPMTDREVLAAGGPAETPLLDEALQRARARQEATVSAGRDGSELVQAVAREVRESSGPLRGSGFDPVEPQEVPVLEAGPQADLVLTPPPGATAVIEPLVGLATVSQSDDRLAPGGEEDSEGVAGKLAEPPGHEPREETGSEPKDKAPALDEEWARGLSRLREVAIEKALIAGPDAERRSKWEMRAGLLSWLGSEDRTVAGAGNQDLNQHPLWPVAFALLAEGATGEKDVAAAGEAKADLDLRAAAWAIESRMAFRISALELCRKVRSFGNYDVADGRIVEPGQTVTLYCEMEGISFEPMAEGVGFRSRLSSSIEVRKPGVERATWSLELGSVQDECRKRRRDYYVNYRVALPGAGTLPPGEYRLTLIQRDELTGEVAEREVGIEVVADAAGAGTAGK